MALPPFDFGLFTSAGNAGVERAGSLTLCSERVLGVKEYLKGAKLITDLQSGDGTRAYPIWKNLPKEYFALGSSQYRER